MYQSFYLPKQYIQELTNVALFLFLFKYQPCEEFSDWLLLFINGIFAISQFQSQNAKHHNEFFQNHMESQKATFFLDIWHSSCLVGQSKKLNWSEDLFKSRLKRGQIEIYINILSSLWPKIKLRRKSKNKNVIWQVATAFITLEVNLKFVFLLVLANPRKSPNWDELGQTSTAIRRKTNNERCHIKYDQ